MIADAFPDVGVASYPYTTSGREVSVVTLSGPRADDAAALLETRVDCFSPEELLDASDRAPPEDLDLALLRLVAGAPDGPDGAVIERVARALEADRADLRRAALQAMVIRPWSAFLPLAERAAGHDVDEETRMQAKIALLQLRDPPAPWCSSIGGPGAPSAE